MTTWPKDVFDFPCAKAENVARPMPAILDFRNARRSIYLYQEFSAEGFLAIGHARDCPAKNPASCWISCSVNPLACCVMTSCSLPELRYSRIFWMKYDSSSPDSVEMTDLLTGLLPWHVTHEEARVLICVFTSVAKPSNVTELDASPHSRQNSRKRIGAW